MPEVIGFRQPVPSIQDLITFGRLISCNCQPAAEAWAISLAPAALASRRLACCNWWVGRYTQHHMKSTAPLMLVGILLLTGCASTQHGSQTQASAIESAFAQRAKLEGKDQRIGILNKQHVAEMMAIPVQNCPADFRSAWFDYLVAVDNLHTRVERVAMIAAGLGRPVTDLPSLVKFVASDKALGQYMLSALNQVDEAWSRLERTAMDYGVMPER